MCLRSFLEVMNHLRPTGVHSLEVSTVLVLVEQHVRKGGEAAAAPQKIKDNSNNI